LPTHHAPTPLNFTEADHSARTLQLWAGPECTVNRVGDRWFDQCEATGFAHRLDDLDRLASLGARRVRFPLLWERTAPEAPDRLDWTWADRRIERLRELGLPPIAGLVHHGAGPHYTDLLDPAFPHKLADYAARVAERYPDLLAYTPVNEPLTTARFAALYGHWHPHRRDDASFVRALLNEMRGTVLAMQAIRRVQPAAELVQTDDLGNTAATPALQPVADFYNERRWLAYDLLFGRVRPGHALWDYLLRHGATEAEVIWFEAAACPADIVGLNSYITSERFLDDRLSLYPPERVDPDTGYVDVEAVRVLGAGVGGFAARLREAHARYQAPLAITEVHIGCSREEQLRWLQQAWDAALAVRAEGADVRAVTCWAAFGSVDWDSLLTKQQGHYEPGLWDVRGPEPRLTAIGALARKLGLAARAQDEARSVSQGRQAAPAPTSAALHPALHGPGWWQRELRLVYAVHGEAAHQPTAGPPLLITGARGTLGRAFAEACAVRGLPCHLLTRQEMDIADAASVAAALQRWQPWGVINTAGYVRVDDAEQDGERQWRENALGPAVLAAACAEAGIGLMTFSSDLVFDGGGTGPRRPYDEAATAQPLNAYGRAKLAAERGVLARWPQALVVRTAAFFGPSDGHNFITQGLARLQRDEPWLAAADQVVSPTYVPDLVSAALDLWLDGEQGVWHLANEGEASWAELACQAAEAAGLSRAQVQAVPGASLGQRAPRPAYSALTSRRGRLMPDLPSALARYAGEWRSGTVPR
jgi:dTDP-4-dehydrorhamnose reductase